MSLAGQSLRLAENNQVTLKVDSFKGGVNTLFSETRLKPEEAKEATNLMLDEDGVWRKRWGTETYGTTGLFTNTLDGFTEYKKTDDSRELIVVADGKVWVVDPTAVTKTEVTGATFTQGTRCAFLQVSDKLLICNGTDNMALYDGSTLTAYSSISSPTWDGTPITRTGLTAGSYTYYYRVSAVNGVGETLANAEQSITTNLLRSSWNSTNYLTLGWADVTNAVGYVVYMSDTSGYEVKLATTTVSSYVDDGTAEPNPYIEPPLSDSSAGPKFSSVCLSGNRIWGTGDPANEQTVYYSGTGTNIFNFAYTFGGGAVSLEQGGKDQCVAVRDYNNKPHIWCKTDDGRGSIWNITLTSVTIASTLIEVPSPEKLVSKEGSPAERSVIHVENDIYFFNPDGVFVLGYEANILNVLRANELSASIRPYITSLYEPDTDKCSAFYYDGKVFFSVSTSAGEPRRTIVYDREFKAWVKDWSVGVSQWGTFTDASGNTHLLGISGNLLIEFSQNYEGDSGTAFTWKYISPRFQVSKDWTEFARIKRAYVRLRNATGSINFIIRGTRRNEVVADLAADTITPGTSDTGMGWDQFGTVKFGSTSGTPTLYASESLPRYLEIRDLIRDIQWEVYGTGIADSAVITGLMAKGNLVKVAEPESWRLD